MYISLSYLQIIDVEPQNSSGIYDNNNYRYRQFLKGV